MTRKQQRFVFTVVGILLLGAAVGLILYAMKDGVSYFKSPTDVVKEKPVESLRLRLGGLVKNASIKKNGDAVEFVVTDNVTELKITYKGVIPDLFKEGQGVVVEGYMGSDNVFKADSLLAKHDENYMPKEVTDSLKQQGHWKEDSQTESN